MSRPNLINLTLDNWSKCSTPEKLEALQDLNSLYNPKAMPGCEVVSAVFKDSVRGRHLYTEYGNEQIFINQKLLNSAEPYQAVETFLHENRHSYQHFVVDHPELAENQQQYSEWMMASNGGYISPEPTGYSLYAMQPVEIDARATARIRTDELFEGIFHDENYSSYKLSKEIENLDLIREAQEDLGNNYEAIARETVRKNFERVNQLQADNQTQPGAEQAHHQYHVPIGEVGQMQPESSRPNIFQDNMKDNSLTYDEYNSIIASEQKYYEDLRSHLEQMKRIGNLSMIEEDESEMKSTSSKLHKLMSERNEKFNLTGEERTKKINLDSINGQTDKSLKSQEESKVANLEAPMANAGTQASEVGLDNADHVKSEQAHEFSETTNTSTRGRANGEGVVEETAIPIAEGLEKSPGSSLPPFEIKNLSSEMGPNVTENVSEPIVEADVDLHMAVNEVAQTEPSLDAMDGTKQSENFDQSGDDQEQTYQYGYGL